MSRFWWDGPRPSAIESEGKVGAEQTESLQRAAQLGWRRLESPDIVSGLSFIRTWNGKSLSTLGL